MSDEPTFDIFTDEIAGADAPPTPADAATSGAHGAGRTNENFRILNAVAMRRAHEEYLIQFINMAAGFG